MTAHTRLDPPLVESIRKALTGNALPGETQGLTREAEREAAGPEGCKHGRGAVERERPPLPQESRDDLLDRVAGEARSLVAPGGGDHAWILGVPRRKINGAAAR